MILASGFNNNALNYEQNKHTKFRELDVSIQHDIDNK